MLVATFSNLNAVGERSFPAIKIVREPLELIPEALRVRGTLLVSACVYLASDASAAEGYWDDFRPLLIETIVKDLEQCVLARARLKDLAWTALDLGVRALNGERSCGIHRVDVPHEIVWNAF